MHITYIEEIENNKKVDKTIEAQPNKSILEISLGSKIPHVHACGGNAKCSTCRIMVLSGMENLSEISEKEKILAQKKGFSKNIRLACQTYVRGDVKIKRLVKDELDEEIALSNQFTGKEVSLAILFADIRNFTSFTERHLAYDVIHILNRFYKRMGDAILNHQGYIDKFMGDGILALFGINDKDSQQKCTNALNAAFEMKNNLQEINQYLRWNFNEEFQVGIGLHFGSVIVGDLGHPEKKQLTAIGDAVNFTSRLEKFTKSIKTTILISEEFAKVLNNPEILDKEYKVQIRGKTGTHKIYSLLETQKTYTSLRNLLKEKMNKTLAPSILRLVFHDVMSGGVLTAHMHDKDILQLELSKPENQGLEEAVKFIQKIKNILKEEPYSYRDILYLSGAVAVEITHGPYINLVIPSYSNKQFLEIGIPLSEEKFESFYKKFQQLGLSKKEMVALIGAHTLGKENQKPFTEDPFKFDNSYFKRLLFYQEDSSLSKMLYTDWELLKDQECKKYIEEFAIDENHFFEEFKNAYIKMIQFAV